MIVGSTIRICLARIGVLTIVIFMLLEASASASRWGPWHAVGRIDSSAGLTALSCPSASLCVAVDGAGNVLTSTHPAAASAWTIANVDRSEHLAGISCPAASLCVATDWAGDAVASTDPTSGAGGWRIADIDGGNPLGAISCPSTSLCVAADEAGDVVTSSDPASAASTWAVSHVDDGIDYECYHYGSSGQSCQPALGPVSCPLSSLCVAVDTAGNVLVSRSPTGGIAAWPGASPDGAIPESEAYDGISCPSSSLCVAVDNYAGDVVTWDPTGSSSSRRIASIDPDSELTGASCVSVSSCFVFDASGRVFASTNPSGGKSAWSVSYHDTSGGVHGADVTAISCPFQPVCIAVDSNGYLLVGSRPASTRQITALLRRVLTPSGHGGRIAALRKHSGYRVSFAAPTAGRLQISWYLVVRHAHHPRRKLHTVLVATGTTNFAKAEIRTIKIELTHDGKQLIKDAKHLRLIARGTFVATPRPRSLRSTLSRSTASRIKDATQTPAAVPASSLVRRRSGTEP